MSVVLTPVSIRPATADDAQTIFDFIYELAVYEKAEDEVKTNVQGIRESMFGKHNEGSHVKGLIGEIEEEGVLKPIGFAVYFYNYSTWQGKKGLYLEDLYISPAYRGIGAGKRIMHQLAQIAVQENCGRFEWSVLDWNQLAIDMYQSIGAKPLDEWVRYRLAGEDLLHFAQSASEIPLTTPQTDE